MDRDHRQTREVGMWGVEWDGLLKQGEIRILKLRCAKEHAAEINLAQTLSLPATALAQTQP